MQNLIWIGAVISVLGLAGILYCIWQVMAAKRAGLDEAALKARLQSVVAINLAALLISVLGLMLVVLGIVLR